MRGEGTCAAVSCSTAAFRDWRSCTVLFQHGKAKRGFRRRTHRKPRFSSYPTMTKAWRLLGPNRKTAKWSSREAARSIPNRNITAKLVRSTSEKS